MTATYLRPLARTCIDCGATLPPERRGFYCTEHGRESNGTRHALVSVVWSSRDRYWAVTVERCPFCGRKHHHGGGNGEAPDLGARRAHCITGLGGTYELVAAPPLPHGCPGCHVVTDRGIDRCSGCQP